MTNRMKMAAHRREMITMKLRIRDQRGQGVSLSNLLVGLGMTRGQAQYALDKMVTECLVTTEIRRTYHSVTGSRGRLPSQTKFYSLTEETT